MSKDSPPAVEEPIQDELLGPGWERAGDACMRLGARERAVENYGHAINLYIDAGRPELARGVAQKLIRIHPDVVRTYCTLTWLDLGMGYLGDARIHLGGYVAAARRARKQHLAIPHVRAMAEVVKDEGFRRAAATALEELDDEVGAAGLRAELTERQQPLRRDEETTCCFRAARKSGRTGQAVNDE